MNQPKFIVDKEGVAYQDRLENTLAVMEHHGMRVRYNEMTHSEEYRLNGELVDGNLAIAKISEWGRSYGYRPYMSALEQHLTLLREADSYHPVVEWLNSTPWDGKDRFEDLFASLTLADPDSADLARTLLEKWCLGAVESLTSKSGSKNENVFVLAGPQGCHKTLWFTSLAPPRAILTGHVLEPSSKDSVSTATTHWLVELGELDGTFRKADIAALKAFLSKPSDTYRLPYARRDTTFPRRTAFCASVNESTYLQDRTGNRRFWTIAVTACNWQHGIDMQQLWAQLRVWLTEGKSKHLDDLEFTSLTAKNHDHEEEDTYESAVLDCYAKSETTEVEQADIRNNVRHLFSSWTARDDKALTSALRRITGQNKPRKSHGKRYWGLAARDLAAMGADGAARGQHHFYVLPPPTHLLS